MSKKDSIKKTKKYRFAHTNQSQLGMGDNYHTGIRNPLGRMRQGMGMQKLDKNQIGTPPKTLA